MGKEWWPTKEQYDPGLTKSDWLAIISDRSLCNEKWLHILARFYEYGGTGACSEVEDYYEEDRFTYNIMMRNFAMKIIDSGRCEVFVDKGNNTYFPVLFLGRTADKNDNGSYIWKIREELYDALTEFDIQSWDQKYLLRILVDQYKILIAKTGYKDFVDEELYKWQYITDNRNSNPLEIIDYLIKNNMNIYDRVRDSQSWKTLINDNPQGLEAVVNKLRDESVDLHKRLDDFREGMKGLFASYTFNSYANDERTAACFLSCWYPQKYTLYKDGNLYDPLCVFLGVDKKAAGSKYEHFLEITRQLSDIVHDDTELQNLYAEKTKGYVQSDILIAQTVIWCVFCSRGQEVLFGKKRNYWSGEVMWDGTDKTQEFIEKGCWQIGWKDKKASNQAKKAWRNIEKIQPGDYMAFHNYDSQGNLAIYYLAEVKEKDTENGILYVNKLPEDDYYTGKAPKMKNRTWYDKLTQVVGSNVINTIFHIDKEEVVMIPEKIVEYGSIINSKKNVILQGAPGTGKTYSTAALALSIIKRTENSVTNVNANSQQTPIFWIDMALLYEHYVYGLLYKTYGSDIKYQASGWFRWRPDFLHIGEKLIMDAKYMPGMDSYGPSGDIVAQLGGYSRVNSFTDALGVSEDTVVPCVILYPVYDENPKTFQIDKEKSLLQQATPIKHLVKFYKIGVPVPKL